MSTISTVPPLLEIAVSETRIWPLDMTPTLLAMGLTGPTSPTVTVVDPVTNLNVNGAVGTVTLNGNIITATVNGSALTYVKAYRMLWTAIAGGQTITWVTQLNAVD
jgi:hypothetical protein